MSNPERKLRVARFGCWLAIVIACSGCADLRYLGDSKTLLTTADQRTVTVHTPERVTPAARVVPKQVFCAEPSPDVAKAFSEAFSLSGALEGAGRGPQLPADIAVKAAAEISKSRAEALAQLTNRLATIQLLRDGLYRACEADANGALSPVTYSVILSGYGDTMVTLLTGELVAGNFGQSLAVLGMSASAAATASTDKAAKDQEQAREDHKKVDDAQTKLQTTNNSIATANADLAKCENETCRAEKQKQLTDLNSQRDADTTNLTSAVFAAMGSASAAGFSNAAAVFGRGVGEIPQGSRPNADNIPQTLEAIQAKFVDHMNADAVPIACLTVLEDEPNAETKTGLAEFCRAELPKLADAQRHYLQAKSMRAMGEPSAVIAACVSEMRGPKSSPGLIQFCEQNLKVLVEADGNVQTQKAELSLIEAKIEYERLRAKSSGSAAEPASATRGAGAVSAATPDRAAAKPIERSAEAGER